MSVAGLLSEHSVIVCVGSGGVGKTTIAAALALRAAAEGKRAMVLTIDPARRLAQALGLDTLASGGQRVSDEALAAAGCRVSGTLSAGMLEQKGAWDDFIRRSAASDEIAEAILANEFYGHLSVSFAGSAEYMAVEELARIVDSEEYDVVVLDTPPTAHALDFLLAPRRLREFLDRSLLGWLVKPSVAAGRVAWKTARRSLGYVLDRLEEATGAQALASIAEFFVAMDSLFDGVAERGARVSALLESEQTAFVLVAGPDDRVLDESDYLQRRMAELGVPLRAVVGNRLAVCPQQPDTQSRAEAAVLLDGMDSGELARNWLLQLWDDAWRVSQGQELRLEAFEAQLPREVRVARVPEMDHDLHELSDLAMVAAEL
jgi:anion-transporting  ArsA/GET3 family ATPase